MMSREIANLQVTGTGSSIPLKKGDLNDWHFAVQFVTIALICVFTNANVGAQTVLGTNFCVNTKIDWKWNTGDPFIQDMPLLMIEQEAQVQRQGRYTAAVECVTRSVSAGPAVDTTVTYFIDIPIRLPLAARPADFDRALAFLGQLTVTPGATGNADVVLKSYTTEVIAVGGKTDYVAMGPQQMVKRQASASPVARDTFDLQGQRLQHLGVSTAVLAQVVQGTTPRVNIDDGANVVDLQNLNAVDVQRYMGQPFFGSYPARAAGTISDFATLVNPGPQFEISQLKRGQRANITYGANAATAGSQFVVGRLIGEADTPCIRGSIPGVGAMTDDAFLAATDVPTLRPAQSVDPEIKSFLPIRLYKAGLSGTC